MATETRVVERKLPCLSSDVHCESALLILIGLTLLTIASS